MKAEQLFRDFVEGGGIEVARAVQMVMATLMASPQMVLPIAAHMLAAYQLMVYQQTGVSTDMTPTVKELVRLMLHEFDPKMPTDSSPITFNLN